MYNQCNCTRFQDIKMLPCFRYDNRGPCTVVLGAHDISKKEKSQQRIKVAKYYRHPKFNGKYDYDIMLLKVKLIGHQISF